MFPFTNKLNKVLKQTVTVTKQSKGVKRIDSREGLEVTTEGNHLHHAASR